MANLSVQSVPRRIYREFNDSRLHPIAYLRRLGAVRHPQKPSQSSAGTKTIFSLDLHAAGTGSVRGGLIENGVELTQWMIGDPKHIGRDRPRYPVSDPVAIVNRHSWKQLSDSRVERFWARYGTYLNKFDGFLVNHSSPLAKLFIPSEKPILIHNTSRYEYPYTLQSGLWESLDRTLIQGVASGQITIVSNNRADADYLTHYTGIQSHVMPSVTDYINGRWNPQSNQFGFTTLSTNLAKEITLKGSHKIRSIRELFPKGYSHSELFALAGVVVIPYQVSTMTIFELMNAGVPLLIPSDDLLHQWYESYEGVLSQLSYLQVEGQPTNTRPKGDPNRVCDRSVRQWWLDRADFSTISAYPMVTRFTSLEHLLELTDGNMISNIESEFLSWLDDIRLKRSSLLRDFVSQL